ncbi:cupin domain-containing protein [Pelagibacterium montanilacus]|uniref:cupin domain-containing protein n=1 Tax=Pelagibacterium montanilacus TaxID=2185280 RepID=UPI000F8F67F4|nr:cupin domain-containing protein [Pelagibacterium montanilacus]
MTDQNKLFAEPGEGDWVTTPDGNKRRIVLHTPELMVVEFAFEPGAVGDAHSHPHVQASYVAHGRFEVTIGDATRSIGAGGSFIVPSGVTHGVKALETGRLVDSFTPAREDFLAADRKAD